MQRYPHSLSIAEVVETVRLQEDVALVMQLLDDISDIVGLLEGLSLEQETGGRRVGDPAACATPTVAGQVQVPSGEGVVPLRPGQSKLELWGLLYSEIWNTIPNKKFESGRDMEGTMSYGQKKKVTVKIK